MPPTAAPQSSDEILNRLLQFFQGLSLKQRFLLGSGVVLVGGTLWAFVALVGQPKYITLYSGLRPEEARAMGGRLAAKNIAYQISPDGGSVLVPEDKVDSARLESASAGLPRNARLGFELFDAPNWAGSDFTEKVNYQRALEGELERTLATLSDVEAVRVHLVMPQESLFTEQERPAKASVILKTRGGGLSEAAQQSIPQLVASAVEGLQPQNVTVVDADSNTPLLRGRNAAGASSGYSLDQELTKTVLHTLEPVVGSDHVRASVHVEYALGTSEDTQETYDPKATATLTQQHSEESSNGAAPAGVPGTASNVPAGTPAPTAASAAEQSSSRSDSTTYAVSKVLHHSVEPPGRVRRIAAAVLVDDVLETAEQAGKPVTTRRKRTPEEMKQIEQLASAAIGVDAQRGDVLAVENLSFQELPKEVMPPPARLERWRHWIEPWSWMLRYLGVAALFLVVYTLVLRPVTRQAIAAFRALPGQVAGRALAAPAPEAGALGSLEIPGVGGEEGKRAGHLKRLLSDKVKAEPGAASRLVESWVREEKGK